MTAVLATISGCSGRLSSRRRTDGLRASRHDRPEGLADLPGDDELRRSGRRGRGCSARTTPSRSCGGRSRRASTSSTPPTCTRAARSEEITGRLLAKLFAQPRRLRARDQGLLPDGAGPERPRPVAQAHPRRHRRVAAPARHRLRRPLPDPPLGLRDADRGDDGGAARRRPGRQGPLHRRVQHVRLAVREGAAHRPRGRLDAVRRRCRTTTTSSTARRSGR